jgi:hypothetical protein
VPPAPKSVERLEHRGEDPWTHTPFAMTTLIASVRPQAPHQFVLASHFDTRPWAESDPDPARREQAIPGANDGSSGLAVLLELAPLLAVQLAPEVGFSLIFFDGEELGQPGRGSPTALVRARSGKRSPRVAFPPSARPASASCSTWSAIATCSSFRTRAPAPPRRRSSTRSGRSDRRQASRSS